MTWWVVQTESQREHIVRVLLMRAKYETYIPRIKHRSRISRLFPELSVRSVRRRNGIRCAGPTMSCACSCPAISRRSLPEAIIDEHPQTRNRRIREIAHRRQGCKKASMCASSAVSFEGQVAVYEGMRQQGTGTGSARSAWAKKCQWNCPIVIWNHYIVVR